MRNVKGRLSAWHDAEHRCDSLAPGSGEWRAADEDVRGAAKAFHAGVAQASSWYAEEESRARKPTADVLGSRDPWSTQLGGD